MVYEVLGEQSKDKRLAKASGNIYHYVLVQLDPHKSKKPHQKLLPLERLLLADSHVVIASGVNGFVILVHGPLICLPQLGNGFIDDFMDLLESNSIPHPWVD